MTKVFILTQELCTMYDTFSEHIVGIFASKQGALKYILEQYPHAKHIQTYDATEIYRSEGKIIIGDSEFKVSYIWKIKECDVIE